MHLFNIWNKNQQMSLFQFYSYIAGSLHVSGPQAHLQESSYSCSHNHWFSICAAQSMRPEQYRHWTNGCVNSCTKSPEDGPVGPKHVEIRQYTNKIVTSVGFHSIDRRMFGRCLHIRRSILLRIKYLKTDVYSSPFTKPTPAVYTNHSSYQPIKFSVTCKSYF